MQYKQSSLFCRACWKLSLHAFNVVVRKRTVQQKYYSIKFSNVTRTSTTTTNWDLFCLQNLCQRVCVYFGLGLTRHLYDCETKSDASNGNGYRYRICICIRIRTLAKLLSVFNDRRARTFWVALSRAERLSTGCDVVNLPTLAFCQGLRGLDSFVEPRSRATGRGDHARKRTLSLGSRLSCNSPQEGALSP